MRRSSRQRRLDPLTRLRAQVAPHGPDQVVACIALLAGEPGGQLAHRQQCGGRHSPAFEHPLSERAQAVALHLAVLERSEHVLQSLEVLDGTPVSLCIAHGSEHLEQVAQLLAALAQRVDVLGRRLGRDRACPPNDPCGSSGTAGDGAVERLAVVMAGDPRSPAAQDLVSDLRAVPPPAGVPVLVGGETAFLVDSLDSIADQLPLAIGLIVLTTFIVLFLFTGSVVQPVRALLSNALTLGATLGLMALIFQQGNGSDLLGFTPQPLDMAMMVLLFCIVFGLSTDYEVFVMSRIKEQHDAGAGIVASTVHGLSHTGRIVTVAAALIAVSFFAFVSSEVSFIKLFGLGTGLAILLDATVVRGILVPASMRLLGVNSWYAPAALRRLHAQVGLAEA